MVSRGWQTTGGNRMRRLRAPLCLVLLLAGACDSGNRATTGIVTSVSERRVCVRPQDPKQAPFCAGSTDPLPSWVDDGTCVRIIMTMEGDRVISIEPWRKCGSR
jgi:hypothetical protein